MICVLVDSSNNQLGNNDGMNLSSPSNLALKEVYNSNVSYDMVSNNGVIYECGKHSTSRYTSSKRAMDKYTSEIFMCGKNTIELHNTWEDTLLAAPIILDLVRLAELSTKICFSELKDRANSTLSKLRLLFSQWRLLINQRHARHSQPGYELV